MLITILNDWDMVLPFSIITTNNITVGHVMLCYVMLCYASIRWSSSIPQLKQCNAMLYWVMLDPVSLRLSTSDLRILWCNSTYVNKPCWSNSSKQWKKLSCQWTFTNDWNFTYALNMNMKSLYKWLNVFLCMFFNLIYPSTECIPQQNVFLNRICSSSENVP